MEMISFLIPLLISAMIFPPGCRAAGKDVNEKEEIRRSLTFTDQSSPHKVIVDNINGSIDVVGYDGTTIELIVHKTLTAESNDKLAEAKKKITVDITQESDRIIVYVNTPWRYENGSIHYDSDYFGYNVYCDFELKVPKIITLALKTVNDGSIHVNGVHGDFEVRNVNKGVRLTDIDGSGNASTVNGDVEVRFARNPTEASSFKTINGEVNVKFQPNLSANVRLKTMNGEVYTDFEFTSIPTEPVVDETRFRRKIYRSGDSFSVRIGRGGPELSFNTLNGNIYIQQTDGNQ